MPLEPMEVSSSRLKSSGEHGLTVESSKHLEFLKPTVEPSVFYKSRL